jgi:peptidoglycan hydrolase CwlO-like protein
VIPLLATFLTLTHSVGVTPIRTAALAPSEAAAIVIVIAALVIASVIYSARRSAAARQAGARAMVESHARAAEREDVMFEQHRQLNDLTRRKLELELKLMETQLRIMEADIHKREESTDFHNTMIQKTQLEIDSLRLHIREQRKRLDDYGQFGE